MSYCINLSITVPSLTSASADAYKALDVAKEKEELHMLRNLIDSILAGITPASVKVGKTAAAIADANLDVGAAPKTYSLL